MSYTPPAKFVTGRILGNAVEPVDDPTSRPAAPESCEPPIWQAEKLLERERLPLAALHANGLTIDLYEWARALVKAERHPNVDVSEHTAALGRASYKLEELAAAVSLAQTEIKGHMRIEDDLKRGLEEMTISNRYHAEDSLKHLHRAEAAEARIAALERVLRDLLAANPRYDASAELDAAIDAALKASA